MTVAQGVDRLDDFAGRLIYNVQQEGKHAFLRRLVPQHAAWSDGGGTNVASGCHRHPSAIVIENKRLVGR